MPDPKLSGAPSPRTFSEALRREVIEPAAAQVAGQDGRIDAGDAAKIDALDGAAALARDALDDREVLTGSATPDTAAFVEAATARAKEAAAIAAGPDGRLSKADAENLPPDLRVAFHYLKTGDTGAAAPAVLTVPDRQGVRFSENVFRAVAEAYGLTDGEALLDKALEMGDGNAYVNRSELEDAAEALRQDSTDPDPHDRVTDPPTTDVPDDFRFSESVLAKVMDEFGIQDRGGLLEVATRHDLDGNRYLKRSELEAAAKELTSPPPSGDELGILSDIDKTLLPPHPRNGPLPPAYPGVSFLLGILEHGYDPSSSGPGNGADGDTHYVTARSPDRVTDIPDWMDRENLPTGHIDTGVSGIPWVAQAEKVRDISSVFDANPDQRFIMFGDSSHRDPEAYREIMAKYPDRVIAGFIHKVNNPNPSRVQGLHLVTDYAQAAAILYEMGVLTEDAARAVMVRAQAEGLTITDAQMDALIDEHRPQ